ncbi:type III pantothenate kinase [bacterium]|nr:MAG: type III pantothenate kinase [bacterium]
MMLLAIDIGNTNINLGLFSGRRLKKRCFIPTKEKNYCPRLNKFLGKRKKTIQDVIICSVVPKSSQALAKDLKRLFGKRPIIIGKDINVPIKNLYRRPRQVGQDRLVNAYAASMLYGAPLIVVDFGTAVTFDVISKNKEYLGGMILPGLGISLDSLAEKTALLPRITLSRPREFIGRDTKNSMLSGIVYGFAAMTDDLASRIKRIIGRKAKVIATGGNIGLMANYCRKIDKIDPDLTLKGLALICNRNTAA